MERVYVLSHQQETIYVGTDRGVVEGLVRSSNVLKIQIWDDGSETERHTYHSANMYADHIERWQSWKKNLQDKWEPVYHV